VCKSTASVSSGRDQFSCNYDREVQVFNMASVISLQAIMSAQYLQLDSSPCNLAA
jgi:hypothetical protein